MSKDDEVEEFDYVRRTSTIDNPDENQRAIITIEFIFNILHFCREMKMNLFQAQTFLRIAQSMYNQCIFSQEEGNVIDRETAMVMFKAAMRETLENMPDGDKLIPSRLVKAFIDCFASAFFRHYASYQLVFGEFQDVSVERVNLSIEKPTRPAPLGAGGAGYSEMS